MVVLSSTLFGLIVPILICVLPQMWRRMHAKEYFDNNNTYSINGNHLNETFPFLNNPNIINQTNSAALTSTTSRYPNDSPSFERLVVKPISKMSQNSESVSKLNKKHSQIHNSSKIRQFQTLNRHLNQCDNNIPTNLTLSNNLNQTLKHNNKILDRNELIPCVDSHLLLNNNSYTPRIQSYSNQNNNAYHSNYYSKVKPDKIPNNINATKLNHANYTKSVPRASSIE